MADLLNVLVGALSKMGHAKVGWKNSRGNPGIFGKTSQLFEVDAALLNSYARRQNRHGHGQTPSADGAASPAENQVQPESPQQRTLA